jgi:hypothetical protein
LDRLAKAAPKQFVLQFEHVQLVEPIETAAAGQDFNLIGH